MRHGGTLADFPFEIESSRAITRVSPTFAKAGLQKGDEVVSVNGVPLTGRLRYSEQIRSFPAGANVTVQVLRHGRPLQITAPLDHFQTISGVGGFIFGYILSIGFPTLCSLIGLWVLFSRPRDPAAWGVFAILSFLSLFFNSNETFAGPAMEIKSLIAEMFQAGLVAGAVWIGLTFPEQLPIDRKRPWIKWVFTWAAVALLLVSVLQDVVADHWIDGFRYLPVFLFAYLAKVESGLTMIAISILCTGIFKNYFSARSPDSRRRMRVLLLGSQLGLWPIFLLVIYGAIRGKNAGQVVPFPVLLVVLALFVLFPLSLAYSIVVERAMDVSILVRQGTRYALARGGLWVIQALLATGMALSIQHVVRHPDHSRRETAGLLVLTALFFAVRLIGRKRARVWIDKKFFREQYSTEQILSELSLEAGRFTETRPLLETISRRITDTLHVNGVAIFLRSGNSFRLQTSEGLTLPAGFMLPESSHAVSELELAHKPATVYFDRPEDWLVEASDAERAALRDLHAEVLLPLPGRGRLMGVMALGPKRSEAPYSKTDLQLLTSVGAQTGLAVENSMLISTLADEAASRAKLNREIEIAREVQERLFPQTFPEVSGVEMAAHCRPAQAVGGDYYDVIAIRDGELMEAAHAPGEEIVSASGAPGSCQRLGIAIGDVSGKGISAALLMASLRASLRSQTLGGSGDLAAKMANVNTLLFDASDSNRYATFFFAELDCESRMLHYVNGGHNPPALLRKAEGSWQVYRLEDGGPVVGLLPGAVYSQQALQLQAGDIFLGYTDGISEAMNPAEDEWGEDRMIAEAQANAQMNAADLLGHLFLAADGFAAGAPQHDDMTLVVMRLS